MEKPTLTRADRLASCAGVVCERHSRRDRDKADKRVYFQQRGQLLVVLLCGGDKRTQSRDIATAKKLAKEWSLPHD